MQAPSWYRRALDVPTTTGDVQVRGVRIHYRVWGPQGAPGVVLIHGSNAHLEWWRFFAPFLADQFRVAALDLSGNGDSEWRDRYHRDDFADEVWAVCEAADLGPNPFVVGHSFGGYVALETAHQHADEVAGLLLMDYTVAPSTQYVEWGLRAEREGVQPKRKLRVYPTKEEIVARFRLIPEQPGVHPLLLEHMALAGIKEVAGGFTWKFDPGLFDYLEMGADQEQKFAGLPCRCALMLGEHSEDEGAFFGEHMRAMSGGYLPIVTVPDTYHHLMFDEPIAVAMTVKMLIAQWHQEDNRHASRNALQRYTQLGEPE